jgi:hypothetical protein
MLEFLQHPEVHLTYGPLKTAAKVEWDNILPPTNVRIKIDANCGDTVNYLIHEIIHILFHGMFLGWVDGKLEEAAVVGLDQYMYEYVKRSPVRFARWNDTISTKLNENKPEKSMTELVSHVP